MSTSRTIAPTFLEAQLREYFPELDEIAVADDFALKDLSYDSIPLPASGVGAGTLPSGAPFLVCRYEQNGAPSPAFEVIEFIFLKAVKRVALTTLSDEVNTSQLKGRKYRELWSALRFESGEFVSERKIEDLSFILLMLAAEGKKDKVNHRKLLSAL